MDTDIRRRRIDENGDWEYECSNCFVWLPKDKFKGCVEKIDAYGNCLMCKSCISKVAMKKRGNTIRNEVDDILIKMGYDPYNDDKPVWKQAEERYRNKYER